MNKIVVLILSVIVISSISGATIADAELIYVNADKARFRSGPGTQYDVIWEAPKYYPLEYLAKYKDWYVARDIDGLVGWVHEQVIGKGMAAIVTNMKGNVRKGPGTEYPILFTVEKGWLVKVLENKAPWYHVVDTEGDKYWIFEKLIWMSKD